MGVSMSFYVVSEYKCPHCGEVIDYIHKEEIVYINKYNSLVRYIIDNFLDKDQNNEDNGLYTDIFLTLDNINEIINKISKNELVKDINNIKYSKNFNKIIIKELNVIKEYIINGSRISFYAR